MTRAERLDGLRRLRTDLSTYVQFIEHAASKAQNLSPAVVLSLRCALRDIELGLDTVEAEIRGLKEEV